MRPAESASMETAAKVFFSSPRFAVAGASQDTQKFGYKGLCLFSLQLVASTNIELRVVLAWYHSRNLPVQPVTPSRPSINVSSTEYTTVASPSALPRPSETSLSIITPPPVTLKILQEAKEAGVPAVWLQPGSFDDEGLRYAQKEFKAGVGGDGWCVLVDGDRARKSAQDEMEHGKL